ncbi:MAG: DUF3365 domain-containing protein [Porticoccus sp.]|nr:DUF3365 domain-containing protein [Porticoccus sp.]
MACKAIYRSVFFCALITMPALINAGGDSASTLEQQAENIVKQFAGSLQPRLLEAIQTGGPVEAISVCATAAPEIANRLNRETGWSVKRVSLKARNKSAEPDHWERNTLLHFESRLAAGEMPAQLTQAEQVDGRFRYMKAQIVQPLCLNCHGSALDPDVAQALKNHYPDDAATGYQLGEIRGAFSLSAPQ